MTALLNRSTKGHLAAGFSILVWAMTFSITKILLQDFSPTEILVLRFILATVFVVAFFRIRPRFYGWKQEGLFFLLGLSGVSLYFLAENYALKFTYAANVGLIVALIPLLTAAGSHLFTSGERFSLRFFAGALISSLGVGLIVLNGQTLHLNPWGDLLAFGAALCFAAYNLLVRVCFPDVPDGEILQRTFLYGTLSAALFLPLDMNPGHVAHLAHPFSLLSLVLLALIASGVCYYLWNKAVVILGPVRTSMYIYLVPFVNMVFCALLLGEVITLMMAAGGLLVIAGMMVKK